MARSMPDTGKKLGVEDAHNPTVSTGQTVLFPSSRNSRAGQPHDALAVVIHGRPIHSTSTAPIKNLFILDKISRPPCALTPNSPSRHRPAARRHCALKRNESPGCVARREEDASLVRSRIMFEPRPEPQPTLNGQPLPIIGTVDM